LGTWKPGNLEAWKLGNWEAGKLGKPKQINTLLKVPKVKRV
jgi:hypothetical protein